MVSDQKPGFKEFRVIHSPIPVIQITFAGGPVCGPGSYRQSGCELT